MLAEILGAVEKTNTRPLLIAFVALSGMSLAGSELFHDPISWGFLLLLPVAVAVADVLVFLWGDGVTRLNAGLRENDIASWGPFIGCAVLALCLQITFRYLATHPEGLTFSLVAEPGFIYLCSLYLLALETLKIKRWR